MCYLNCDLSFELSQQDGSNEWLHCMFILRNKKKKILELFSKPTLSGSLQSSK